MYTLMVNINNTITTTKKERIVQRSKLVDAVHILLPVDYKGMDMNDFDVTMLYELPISEEKYSLGLTKEPELYKDEYIEFIIPADTWITKEPGTVKIELTISKVEIDENAITTQYIRKATGGTIEIASCEDWSTLIPDGLLTALDQRIIAIQAKIEEFNDASQDMYEAIENKADNLSYEDKYLQLVSNNVKIGDPIVIRGAQTPEEYEDGDTRVINI